MPGDRHFAPTARSADSPGSAGSGDFAAVNGELHGASQCRRVSVSRLKLHLLLLVLLAVLPVVGVTTITGGAPLSWFAIDATLVLAVVLAWIATETLILRRVRRLASMAQRLAAGDFQARTGIEHNCDEIGQVAATLDQTAAVLEHRAKESSLQRRRIARLNRMYKVLTGVNGAIQGVHDRAVLLREVCRIAVTQGEFCLAWIGLIEADGGVARVAAWAGGENVLMDVESISLESAAGNWEIARMALREDQRVVCNDCLRDTRASTERKLAQTAGFRSIAAFPLRVEGRSVGALTLCAAEAEFFDSEELRLLDEFAADASLGLEHIAKEQRLHYLAYYDPVTELPNASLFEDRLRQTLARARHHPRVEAVMVLEIADFRRTMSEMGRGAADRLVQEVARYLCGRLRDGDTVARLNGDEFGVILADVARVEDVTRVIGNVMRDFPHSVLVDGLEVFVRIRAGVAIYPSDGDEPETLVKNAYMALRAPGAEATAATVSYYAPEINASIQERRRIERALHHAIEGQEFQVHYQPVVDIATRRLVGVEALARWTSRELGSVPPARFIPVAEETGLVVSLGEWVIENACRQAVRWRDMGFDGLRVAINVSARQLSEPDFMERVGVILDSTGVCVSWLAVEITESSLMGDLDAAITVCRRLRERGLSIYVDDFGTGYSSLGYLHRLPVDVLKIDRSFVQDLEVNKDSVSIVRTIISLAHGLGLRVIAEGVETEGQFALLREMGCDAVQGFLFGKPQPAEALPEAWGKDGQSASAGFVQEAAMKRAPGA